jgi:diguanylate cyclase (GGDEF)-like protein/PAS domain S-box-containing protein
VLEKRQPISILAKDPDADPAEVALLQKNGAVSLLMLPLVVGEQVIGLVELDESERKREFTAAEIRLCQALADQAAVAIQNARLFQETRQRALQLQTIEEVGRKVSAILDPEELFPHVAKTIQHNFGYYHVDIFLVDQATGYAIFKASSDRVMERVWKQQDLRFKIGEEGMIGWVADMGEPLLANDVSQEPRYLPDNLLLETKSELAVPLKVGERVVGVLDVDSDKPNAFDEDDLFVLQTLANQIAVAIENARLYEAEQQRRRDAEALRETVLALTSALDRNQVIERILAQLQQVVPYDSASVQLLQGNRLVITGGRGFSNLPDLLGISFPADGDNPNREVIRTRAPFIVDDAQSVYEGFRKDPHTQTVIRSWLGVPLLIGEQLVGMIALDKREAGFYTEEHARLAQTFAAQAAIAIENARLFEEVEKRRVYLEGVLGSAPDAIVTLDARHRIVEWNPGAERLFGYSREEAIGQDIDDLVTSPDVLEEAVRFSRMAMSGKEVPPIETIRYRKDDSPVDVIVAGSPISVGDEFIGAVAVYTDITRQKRMEEELRALLLVDELTGLYNRRGFLTLGQQQLRMANRMKRRMLLLFGDYNGLKEINDTFGHPEGDRALIEVAGVLQETFRESDIIARIAGDEFVVLALETVDDSAEILATRLQKNVATRNARGDLRYKLSLSVGVACYDPNAPCSIDELVARADRLMYERKRHEQES